MKPYQALRTALIAMLGLLGAIAVHAQVPTYLSPTPKLQFLLQSGLPLSGGKVFTFSAGTSTPAATYVDSSGTSQNANPIILDAGGFANIWLAQQSYKFIVQDSLGNQQYVVDNIGGRQALLDGTNTWTGANIFNGAVTFNSSVTITGALTLALPLSLTASGFTNSLAASVTAARTWTLQDSSDTLVGRATTDTLSNKTLNSTDTLSTVTVGATPITQSFTNNGVGTGTNLLAIFGGGSPIQVQTAATTNTGGILGVCVSNCTTSGTAQITTIGQASCVFDGATTAADYVQNSATVAGNCHDVGTTFPASGQTIGRVLTTNGAGGTFNVVLFGGEQKPPGLTLCQNLTAVTVVNTVATTDLQFCTVPANTMCAGCDLEIVSSGVVTNTSGAPVTYTFVTSLGGQAACNPAAISVPTGSTAIPWTINIHALVLTTGVTGQPWPGSCTVALNSGSGSVTGGGVFSPLVINTTTTNQVKTTITMGTASALASTTSYALKVLNLN